MFGVLIACRRCLTRARSTLSSSAASFRSWLGLLSRHVCVCFTSRILCTQRLKLVRPLAGLSNRLLWPRLTSAATSTFLSKRVALQHRHRSLRVRRVTFFPHIRRIYANLLRMTSGFESLCPLAQQVVASYTVGVPRTGSLPAASFRFRVTPDTLAARLEVPVIKASIGTSTR